MENEKLNPEMLLKGLKELLGISDSGSESPDSTFSKEIRNSFMGKFSRDSSIPLEEIQEFITATHSRVKTLSGKVVENKVMTVQVFESLLLTTLILQFSTENAIGLAEVLPHIVKQDRMVKLLRGVDSLLKEEGKSSNE